MIRSRAFRRLEEQNRLLSLRARRLQDQLDLTMTINRSLRAALDATPEARAEMLAARAERQAERRLAGALGRLPWHGTWPYGPWYR